MILTGSSRSLRSLFLCRFLYCRRTGKSLCSVHLRLHSYGGSSLCLLFFLFRCFDLLFGLCLGSDFALLFGLILALLLSGCSFRLLFFFFSLLDLYLFLCGLGLGSLFLLCGCSDLGGCFRLLFLLGLLFSLRSLFKL